MSETATAISAPERATMLARILERFPQTVATERLRAALPFGHQEGFSGWDETKAAWAESLGSENLPLALFAEAVVAHAEALQGSASDGEAARLARLADAYAQAAETDPWHLAPNAPDAAAELARHLGAVREFAPPSYAKFLERISSRLKEPGERPGVNEAYDLIRGALDEPLRPEYDRDPRMATAFVRVRELVRVYLRRIGAEVIEPEESARYDPLVHFNRNRGEGSGVFLLVHRGIRYENEVRHAEVEVSSGTPATAAPVISSPAASLPGETGRLS